MQTTEYLARLKTNLNNKNQIEKLLTKKINLFNRKSMSMAIHINEHAHCLARHLYSTRLDK